MHQKRLGLVEQTLHLYMAMATYAYENKTMR